MSVTCVHLTIHGNVQGVGYRAWVADRAFKRDVKGWVRNRAEGTVEALFCGEVDHVDLMLAECQHGPKNAKVTHIDIHHWDGEIPEDFQQLPTVYHV